MPAAASPLTLRLFRPADRPALRRVFWNTADQGRPLLNCPIDPELLTDLWTNYYTDIDSEATWVLEGEGGVGGYLTGAFDEYRYRRAMARQVVPRALARAFVPTLTAKQSF